MKVKEVTTPEGPVGPMVAVVGNVGAGAVSESLPWELRRAWPGALPDETAWTTEGSTDPVPYRSPSIRVSTSRSTDLPGRAG